MIILQSCLLIDKLRSARLKKKPLPAFERLVPAPALDAASLEDGTGVVKASNDGGGLPFLHIVLYTIVRHSVRGSWGVSRAQKL